MLKNNLKIQVLNDSETLINVIIRNASTTEKRLMLDVKYANEAYNDVIIDGIIWIRRKLNMADAVTKSTILPECFESLDKSQLHYEIEQSVKRKTCLQDKKNEKVRV